MRRRYSVLLRFYSVLLPAYSVLPDKRLFFEGARGTCAAATPFLLRPALQRQLVDLLGVFQDQLLEGAEGDALVLGEGRRHLRDVGRINVQLAERGGHAQAREEGARRPTPDTRFNQSSFVFQPSRQTTQTSFR